jgi:hypothetical protein
MRSSSPIYFNLTDGGPRHRRSIRDTRTRYPAGNLRQYSELSTAVLGDMTFKQSLRFTSGCSGAIEVLGDCRAFILGRARQLTT